MKSIPLPTHRTIAFVAADETLRPLRDVIIVKPEPPKFSETIAVDWRGKPVRGEVLAVGPGTWPYRHKRGEKDGKRFHTIAESRQFRPTEVRVGDIVELGGLEKDGYDFQTVNWGGVECVIATEKDVCGYVRP
jgi:co-chaperonin GroES (HSP10)